VLAWRPANDGLEAAGKVRLVEVTEFQRQAAKFNRKWLRQPLGRLVEAVALKHPLWAHPDGGVEAPLKAT
jgi:hypothetical protein